MAISSVIKKIMTGCPDSTVHIFVWILSYLYWGNSMFKNKIKKGFHLPNLST